MISIFLCFGLFEIIPSNNMNESQKKALMHKVKKKKNEKKDKKTISGPNLKGAGLFC